MIQHLLQSLSMGDYGGYVWSAYGVFFILIISLYTALKHQLRQTKQQDKSNHLLSAESKKITKI